MMCHISSFFFLGAAEGYILIKDGFCTFCHPIKCQSFHLLTFGFKQSLLINGTFFFEYSSQSSLVVE